MVHVPNSAVAAARAHAALLANLTRVPWKNAEHLQVLRYQPGQFYREHHDQNSPRASAWGPRMFTVFMYVGDGYEGLLDMIHGDGNSGGGAVAVPSPRGRGGRPGKLSSLP